MLFKVIDELSLWLIYQKQGNIKHKYDPYSDRFWQNVVYPHQLIYHRIFIC